MLRAAIVLAAALAAHGASTPRRRLGALRRRDAPSARRAAAPLDVQGGGAAGGGDGVAARAELDGAVFNLVNNVAGCGFLTLSSGMAGSGFVPSVAVLAALGAISCFTFLALGEECAAYGATDLRGLWANAVSEDTAWLVDASVGLFCGAALVIYHGVVGDVFGPVVGRWVAGGHATAILAVAAGCLWPLCQLDLAALARFSLVGCASVAATACVILLRSVDGSYAPGGRYFDAPATRAGGWLGLAPKMLVLSANLGLAYIAHYNAPPLAGSLAPGREPAEAARDFSAVTVRSFAVLIALYAAVMMAKLATGASIIFGFPLVFSAFANWAYSLAPAPVFAALKSSKAARLGASGLLILLTVVVALNASDIGLPAGLAGSLLGGFVVYVLPAAVKWQRAATAAEMAGCAGLAGLGAVLALGASRETRRILLEVPNALGWRLHYGARGKDVAAAVAASGVVGAGPADAPAGAFVAYDAVPYESMWRDDALWLPGVLDGSGRAFAGHFVFAGGPGKNAPLVAHNCASSPRNDAPLVACASSELPVRSYYRGAAPRAGTVAIARRAGRDVAAAGLLAAIDPAADLARWAPLAYDDGRGGWVPLDDVATVRVDAAEARVEFVDRCQSAAISTPPRDGFFGVGIVRGKTGGNDGVLWRSAAQLGAAFSFSVGARFGRLDGATDAIDAWKTVPNFRYDSFADFAKSSPRGAAWVAVEMGGEPLETFVHPDRAVYFLGAEDHGVPKDVLRACRHVVSLPAARSASYNVAVAGALVMYDRLSKRNRPAAPPPPPRLAVRDDAPERDAPARLPSGGDARAAAAVARDPVIAGAAVPRILVLERRAAGLEGIGLDPARVQRRRGAKALSAASPAALRGPAALRAAPDDLSGLPRAELEELARRLTSENAALRRSVEAPRTSFSLGAASLCAGFAFESYNDPDGARWERGADGCDVAFRDASFVRSCYAGALIARVVEARGLEGQQDLQEIALTGSASDPYVRLAVVERSPRGSQRERASNATDVARTETVWRGGDNAVWPDNSHCLYVRDPAAASLAVYDEDVASDDDLLGVAELPLSDILKAGGAATFELPLAVDAEDRVDFDGRIAVAGAAAAAMAGVATGGVALAAAAAAATAARSGAFERLEAPAGPRGASPEAGVDWSALNAAAAPDAGDFTPLCFVDHQRTGTQAGLWRDDRRRRLLISFRGTSEPRDLVTDASALMTPWRGDADLARDGYDDCVPSALGDALVHAGFRGALDSVARRLKQLAVYAATDAGGRGGLPGASAPDALRGWELIVTGHSLGGALATLFAYDVAPGVDAAAALPVRAVSRPWFLPPVAGAAPGAPPPALDRPKFARTTLITFGAPRAGHRVVNGQDVVARLPRGFSYAHCGRTVFISDDASEPALWVEGSDDRACPLKRGDGSLTGVAASGGSSALAGLLEAAGAEASQVKPFDLRSAAAGAARLGRAVESAARAASARDVAEAAGLDGGFVDAELKMVRAIASGDALAHHLEPSYFEGMKRALAAADGAKAA
ncbi:phospholipase [Aureococcus anophagefferens]|nr:phospholipase [Aureococcus anophagefferens]